MSINNIINMACLKGLDIIALTDHNSCKNCPSFLEAAGRSDIIALPGMELNTMEEIHAVCLFKDLEDAMAFDELVYSGLGDIKNVPDIFGEQLLLDAYDKVTGSVEKLLINASNISFFDLNKLVKEYNGIYFPAHIDRSSLSLLANLGFVPPDCEMDAFELADPAKYDEIVAVNPTLRQFPLLKNSDAHYLWDISEAENVLPNAVQKLLVNS